jgi:Protein of unknown function (DUF3726)
MIVSLNEIESTVLKAARGAGLAWGLAEEAAAAAGWLAEHDFDWEDSLIELLRAHVALARPVWTRPSPELPRGARRLCPLATGAALSDAGLGPDAIATPAIAGPLWLVPFAARLVGGATGDVCLAWPGAMITLPAGGGVVVDADHAALHARFVSSARIARATSAASDGGGGASGACGHGLVGHGPVGHVVDRVVDGHVVDDAAWATLAAYEARTFVPATDASRLTGAGAGLSDND